MNMKKALAEELEQKAKNIRKKYLEYVNKIPKAHIGGGLSMCDCVVALYYHFLKITNETERDYFILSKGHCAEMLYCIFAEKGLYDYKNIVEEYNKLDGRFGRHPNKHKIPEIDFNTGALGHGLSVATGMALVLKAQKQEYKVYCLVGDGELNEGSNWEALLMANQYHLDNLCVLVDNNGYSSSDKVANVMSISPLEKKMEAFGLNVISINGNSMEEVVEALDTFTNQKIEKTTAIILNTIKGKGFSVFENEPRKWHSGHVNQELFDALIKETDMDKGVE